MGSVAKIYIPSFIKIGSGIQKLIRAEIHRPRDRMETARAYFNFFQNKERRLKVNALPILVTLFHDVRQGLPSHLAISSPAAPMSPEYRKNKTKLSMSKQ
jgi:hypothetical protein